MKSVRDGFPLKPVCSVVIAALALLESHLSFAQKPVATLAQVEFGNEFLQFPGAPNVDISRFSKGNTVTPGVIARIFTPTVRVWDVQKSLFAIRWETTQALRHVSTGLCWRWSGMILKNYRKQQSLRCKTKPLAHVCSWIS